LNKKGTSEEILKDFPENIVELLQPFPTAVVAAEGSDTELISEAGNLLL